MSQNLAFFRSPKANGFNRAISPSIYMAQFFGLMPVLHVLEYDVMLLEFKLKSWKSFFSIFCIIGTFFNALSSFVLAYNSKFDIEQICKCFFWYSPIF